MSVYIKVQRRGREDRLLVLRQLHCTIGQDDDGLIVTSNASIPWFSIFASGVEYYLQSHQDDLVQLSDRDRTYSVTPLPKTLHLSVADYQLTIVTTEAESSLLAASSLPTESMEKSTLIPRTLLSVKVAHTEQTFPLFLGATGSLGQGDTDTLQLPFQGVLNSHLVFEQREDGAYFWSEVGSFQFNGKEYSSKPICIREGIIQLSPSAIEVEIICN
ncbi:MAG: hypothetical protein KDD70_03880 [Bdellovibrionales bacterium]|nr:hypothetical protein [Bdellovibrionales bacterium]